MSTRQPWITGTSLAVTTALVNIGCAVAVALYPDAVLQLANTWAHGIDFTIIRRAADNPLTFGAWIYGLVTSVAFAFAAGVTYRWSANVLTRLSAARSAGLRASSQF